MMCPSRSQPAGSRPLFRLRRLPSVFLLLAFISLPSCSHSPAPESSGGAAPPVNPALAAEPVTLEVWLDMDCVAPDPLFQEMVADFEAAYPNVDVVMHAYVKETIPDKVSRAIQVGDPPDVVQAHVAAMAAQGFAEPIDDLWAEWDARGEFLPLAMDQVTWDRGLFGVPLDIYTVILVFNKDHFEEAGLPFPDATYDWQRFSQDAATLTRPDASRYGLGFTSDPWYVFAWLAEAGGDLVTGDTFLGFHFVLDDPNNVEALRFLTSMARNGYGPLPTTRPRDYEDPRKLFLNKQIAMFFGTPYDVHYILSRSPDFPVGAAELPKTPAGAAAASALGTTGLFVPRGSRNREIAFEFMKWATSDRYALSMAERLGRYPARAWLQTTPRFAGDPLLKPFLMQLNNARPYKLDAFPVAERAYADAVKAAFYGSEARDALAEARRQIEEPQ